jgi:hypothetical protein
MAALPGVFSDQQRGIKIMKWTSNLSKILKGRLSVEGEGGAIQEIDFSSLGNEVSAIVGGEFSKQVTEASASYGKNHAIMMTLAKQAVLFDLWATCFTALAVLLLAIFAMRTVWIMLQK